VNTWKLARSQLRESLEGIVFSAEAEVCLSCNAELWDDSLRKEFSDWIGKLDPKSKPRIQFKMSRNADQCLHKIMGFFPGAVKTVVVRAMIGVYFEMMRGGSEINDLFNEIFESEYYSSFENDNERVAFHTDVKPLFYFDIESWANLFDMKTNEISLEAFHLMTALCVL
jgi:hypothetical protein